MSVCFSLPVPEVVVGLEHSTLGWRGDCSSSVLMPAYNILQIFEKYKLTKNDLFHFFKFKLIVIWQKDINKDFFLSPRTSEWNLTQTLYFVMMRWLFYHYATTNGYNSSKTFLKGRCTQQKIKSWSFFFTFSKLTKQTEKDIFQFIFSLPVPAATARLNPWTLGWQVYYHCATTSEHSPTASSSS